MISILHTCKAARYSLPILAISLLMGFAPHQCSSQNTPSSYSKRSYPLAPVENHQIEVLKDKVDLPDLPAYSGKSKFVRGYVEAAAKGGTRYDLTFEAEESQSQILDWYDNVFRMYKWTQIERRDSSVSALHKEGHYAVISTNPIRTKEGKAKCYISLHYKLAVR